MTRVAESDRQRRGRNDIKNTVVNRVGSRVCYNGDRATRDRAGRKRGKRAKRKKGKKEKRSGGPIHKSPSFLIILSDWRGREDGVYMRAIYHHLPLSLGWYRVIELSGKLPLTENGLRYRCRRRRRRPTPDAIVVA